LKSKQISSFKESEIGRIPKDWQVLRLEDISQKITDGSHFSPREIGVGNKIIATVKDMRDNGFVFEECKKISDDDFNLLVNNGCEPEQGDILISKDGANCLDLIFVYDQDARIVLLSSIAIIRLKKGFNPWFYRSYLLSPLTQKIMRTGYVSGSAIPRVILSDFKKIPVPVPPYEIQDKVAKTLKKFDERIIALKKSNNVLEEIVKAIFKSWFLDFEGQTEFVNSKLGEIPKGWDIKKIGDVCIIFSGGTPSTQKEEYWNGSVPWLSSGETRNPFILDTEKKITRLGIENSSTRLASQGDVLIASAGQGNTRGQTSLSIINTYINQSIISLRAKNNNILSTFLFYNLKSRYDELRRISDSHSSRGSLTTKTIASLDILLPTENILKSFYVISRANIEQIVNNENAISKLIQTRDYILPKLMSGEIRVDSD